MVSMRTMMGGPTLTQMRHGGEIMAGGGMGTATGHGMSRGVGQGRGVGVGAKRALGTGPEDRGSRGMGSRGTEEKARGLRIPTRNEVGGKETGIQNTEAQRGTGATNVLKGLPWPRMMS